jgi:hypothetical protein
MLKKLEYSYSTKRVIVVYIEILIAIEVVVRTDRKSFTYDRLEVTAGIRGHAARLYCHI